MNTNNLISRLSGLISRRNTQILTWDFDAVQTSYLKYTVWLLYFLGAISFCALSATFYYQQARFFWLAVNLVGLLVNLILGVISFRRMMVKVRHERNGGGL